MTKIRFSTKAETLELLLGRLMSACVLPQVRLSVDEWSSRNSEIFSRLEILGWLQRRLIVRSSALVEDQKENSLAGHFTSVLNVEGKNEIFSAIERVIESFGDSNIKNQIFIQPMLDKIALSGVAFTRNPSSGAPYIIINYDDRSGSTESVTSGKTNELKTYFCVKKTDIAHPDPLGKVVGLLLELESVFENDAIDVEFAVTENGQVYLLQARPMSLALKAQDLDEHFSRALEGIRNKISLGMHSHPYLLGSRTVYGVMPDWNPAEIIGVRPRPFALSLYKEIVTDAIWAYQRDNYGYRNLRSFPLLISFHGLPYIDVRVSFNSFIPNTLPHELAERLANYYINRLIQYPNYHDKVEFEIIYSCYTLDLPKRLEIIKNDGFSDQDLEVLSDHLRCLTNRIIDGQTGLWKKDILKVENLESRGPSVLSSSLDLVSKIYWLLEDCKRFGTLPFAGLARAGFIAVQLLRSLVNVGILSEGEYHRFLESLDTVSSQMSHDFHSLDKDAFLLKYGHLRPGTYDLLSKRYDESPERYFDWGAKKNAENSKHTSFSLTIDQMKLIEGMLAKHGINHTIISFFDFIKSAIEGREYSKFVFSKNLSDSIVLFKKLCEQLGFSEEDASYADISCIKTLHGSSADPYTIIKNSIQQGKSSYSITERLTLPPIITKPEDVNAFHLPVIDPNYITLKSAIGNVVFISCGKDMLPGAILFIPSADPGFDWIFSHRIAGFITMFGGVNSHMAIRAQELGIPAVIGAGESLYSRWSAAKILEINCANRQVNILQ